MCVCVCLLSQQTGKTCQSPRQPDYKQFYDTAQGQLLFYAAGDYTEVQSDQSLVVGQTRQTS